MELTQGHARATIAAITYLPVLGLVLRVDADIGSSPTKEIGDELHELLSHSPFVIWRSCCDTAPVGDEEHAEGCAKAKPAKRGAKKE